MLLSQILYKFQKKFWIRNHHVHAMNNKYLTEEIMQFYMKTMPPEFLALFRRA